MATETTTRPCRKCKVEFSGERCRPCQRASLKRRYAADPEKYRQLAAGYRKAHLEESRARDRAAYATNPEKQRAAQRAWRERNPEKVRAQIERRDREAGNARNRARYAASPARRLRKWDLTPEQYATMLASQGGACAICRRTPTNGRALSVDHDHDTGKIRALLCTGCNVRVGVFEHALVAATRTYLREHEDT